ncbi:serine/Arginine-related protein 53 [Fukomys damarensis]|uniref:serine/Arginine-related protein 53 n=1 Tax=Fukomys damarensis TaxID=885580 RepID=UPI00145507F7|nr:serine/Arginine-related protein 53 [Fukomys damarensis]
MNRLNESNRKKERTLLRCSVVNKLIPKYTDIIPSLLDQATLVEQVKRVKEIEAIESDSFIQQTFRSSKEVKKSVEPNEVKHPTSPSGPASVVADPPSVEKEIDPSSIPTAIKYQDDNSLAHPNLFIEKAEAEEKWFKRLIALRQERLMGSPVA